MPHQVLQLQHFPEDKQARVSTPTNAKTQAQTSSSYAEAGTGRHLAAHKRACVQSGDTLLI